MTMNTTPGTIVRLLRDADRAFAHWPDTAEIIDGPAVPGKVNILHHAPAGNALKMTGYVALEHLEEVTL